MQSSIRTTLSSVDTDNSSSKNDQSRFSWNQHQICTNSDGEIYSANSVFQSVYYVPCAWQEVLLCDMCSLFNQMVIEFIAAISFLQPGQVRDLDPALSFKSVKRSLSKDKENFHSSAQNQWAYFRLVC